MANRAERRRQARKEVRPSKDFYFAVNGTVDYGTNNAIENADGDAEAGTIPLVQARLEGQWSSGVKTTMTVVAIAPVARELGSLMVGAADAVVLDERFDQAHRPTPIEDLTLEELVEHAERRGVDVEGLDPVHMVATLVRKGHGVRYDLELGEEANE